MTGDYSTRETEMEKGPGGIGLTDVYYVLFRRKWVVLAGIVFGIIAAAGVWKLRQPLYQSQAKLMVKYVMDSRSFASLSPDAQVRTTDSGSAGIINSEVEILTSLDIAREVAVAITPERVLARAVDINDSVQALDAATGLIAKRLSVDPPRGSIITLRFEHPVPGTARQVLEQLVETYLKKHRQVHRSSESVDEALIQQRDQLRSQLNQTEEQLKAIKAKAGVVSLEESKKTHGQQLAAIQEALFNAQAEQAQRRAAMSEMRKLEPTNASSDAASSATVTAAPQAKIDEYRRVVAQVEHFDRKERELLSVVTLENLQARTNHLQLVDAQRLKEKLEREYPDLLRTVPTPGPGAGQLVATPGADMVGHRTLLVGLEAKIHALSNQLESVRMEAARVDEAEAAITDLQRKRAQLESQYLYVERGLRQAMFDQALDSGKSANISPVQAPSPPYRDFGALYKKVGMALFGGIALGIGLAFVIELFLVRTLRRPNDVERLLNLPLFLSIPMLRRTREHLSNGLGGQTTGNKTSDTMNSSNSPVEKSLGDGSTPAIQAIGMKPFHEALRDRLVNYFEIREMTHKPKMIAVTSCGDGAGVSSLATGLAASLSETGDGNVLLVDMRGEQGTAHAFYRGQSSCGLVEALEDTTRTNALVNQHLYVATADSADSNLQRILPRQFSRLVPRLKASDYDYIIFDMPPVSQTSITAKVARFMDMVLMVLESEKTDRDVAVRARTVLAESNATVATILNKRRRYVPFWLQQELL